MKSHYIYHYRLALASGFVHFAKAISVLYFAEYGEAMPSEAVQAVQTYLNSKNPFNQ